MARWSGTTRRDRQAPRITVDALPADIRQAAGEPVLGDYKLDAPIVAQSMNENPIGRSQKARRALRTGAQFDVLKRARPISPYENQMVMECTRYAPRSGEDEGPVGHLRASHVPAERWPGRSSPAEGRQMQDG